MEFELEFTMDELEELTGRDLTPDDPTQQEGWGKMYIVKNLSSNQAAVINQAKAALTREFGRKHASQYINYLEGVDPRGLQVWLKYQIERTAYPETYSLIVHASQWLASQ